MKRKKTNTITRSVCLTITRLLISFVILTAIYAWFVWKGVMNERFMTVGCSAILFATNTVIIAWACKKQNQKKWVNLCAAILLQLAVMIIGTSTRTDMDLLEGSWPVMAAAMTAGALAGFCVSGFGRKKRGLRT